MIQYNREELFQIMQVLTVITLTVGDATTILIFNGTVSAFVLIGSVVGFVIALNKYQ